jgi:uncharacterized membrane protein (DUF485 family)
MKVENFTAKIILITIQFFCGVLSFPWWLITYYMITGTLHGDNTASICIPIGIAMLLISFLVAALLIFFQRKAFVKKVHIFIASFLPFLSGLGLFMLCAFLGIK